MPTNANFPSCFLLIFDIASFETKWYNSLEGGDKDCSRQAILQKTSTALAK